MFNNLNLQTKTGIYFFSLVGRVYNVKVSKIVKRNIPSDRLRRVGLGRLIQISYTIRPMSEFKNLRNRNTLVFWPKNNCWPNKKGWPNHTKFNVAFGQWPIHIKFKVAFGQWSNHINSFYCIWPIFFCRIVLYS